MTQQNLADILFISRPTYICWEKDPGKIPLSHFIKIISYFNMDLPMLMEIFTNQYSILLRGDSRIKYLEHIETLTADITFIKNQLRSTS
jgi:DNA-binding XRE family transcriptional regulator